jgi:hypothetical protein
MRSAARLAFALLVASCAPLWFSAPVRADITVASLGVRSVDGETELERRLSTALRASASTIAGWSVGKREASLEQMMLAHSCEEPNATCLAEVVKTLGVQRLVFGSVTNAGGSYELTINQFDGDTAPPRTATTRGLKPAQLRGTAAREVVLALLYQLEKVEPPVAPPANGQLRIHGDIPNAQVSVDGQAAGTLDEQGYLTLELAPGQHTVRAAGQAFGPSEEKVAQVESGQTAQLDLPIAPPMAEAPPPALSLPAARAVPPARPRHNLRRAFGWLSVGLGTAFAIATVYSWVRIEHINDDSDFLSYRSAFPRAGGSNGVSNVCPLAARGELAMRDPSRAGLERRADDLCNEADTLQTLQYVFLGGALVGAGVGTYLLVSARRMERREATSFTVAPRLGFQSASLEARLRF